MSLGVDAPGSHCAFGRGCSQGMAAHGGFDEHHEWPLSLGGQPGQSTLLVLCPNHHRRQHALVRYLVETGAGPRAHQVLDHYTHLELEAARVAYDGWVAAGRPVVSGWPCPAAR